MFSHLLSILRASLDALYDGFQKLFALRSHLKQSPLTKRERARPGVGTTNGYGPKIVQAGSELSKETRFSKRPKRYDSDLDRYETPHKNPIKAMPDVAKASDKNTHTHMLTLVQ